MRVGCNRTDRSTIGHLFRYVFVFILIRGFSINVFGFAIVNFWCCLSEIARANNMLSLRIQSQTQTTSDNFPKLYEKCMCFVISAETHLNNPKQGSLWNTWRTYFFDGISYTSDSKNSVHEFKPILQTQKKYTKLKHSKIKYSNNTLDFDVFDFFVLAFVLIISSKCFGQILLKLCMCPSSHEMSQCEALRVLGQDMYIPRVQPGRNPSPCSSKSDCVADISDA